MLGALQYVSRLIRGKISENEVMVGGEQEVRSADVTVIGIEYVMGCVNCKNDLVNVPNYFYQIFTFLLFSERRSCLQPLFECLMHILTHSYGKILTKLLILFLLRLFVFNDSHR